MGGWDVSERRLGLYGQSGLFLCSIRIQDQTASKGKETVDISRPTTLHQSGEIKIQTCIELQKRGGGRE